MREHSSPHARYQAYGRAWTYYSVERYAKRWGFDTPHGIMGWRESLEQLPFLVTDDGTTIPIHERLYALQRDGSYKLVRCCSSPLTKVSVRNFEGRLVAYFKQMREETTDCFVHPEGQPNYDKDLDPQKKYLHVQFFGEFDPAANLFRVREFLPGFSRDEFRHKIGARGSIEETEAFFYANRTPFMCDVSK